MSDAPKRPRAEILPIAEELVGILSSACVRLEIAGSLRRETPLVGDVELVAIPAIEVVVAEDPGDLFHKKTEKRINRLWAALDGFFEPKLAKGTREGYIKKGEKYRSFVWPTRIEGRPVQVDLFTATPKNWGWIYLLRTGSEDFSHHVAGKLNAAGYCSSEGEIYHGIPGQVDGKPKMVPTGDPIATPEEQSVFDLARIPFREPRVRV